MIFEHKHTLMDAYMLTLMESFFLSFLSRLKMDHYFVGNRDSSVTILVSVPPMLPQSHVKDPCLSAKTAGRRLWPHPTYVVLSKMIP